MTRVKRAPDTAQQRRTNSALYPDKHLQKLERYWGLVLTFRHKFPGTR